MTGDTVDWKGMTGIGFGSCWQDLWDTLVEYLSSTCNIMEAYEQRMKGLSPLCQSNPQPSEKY